MKRVGQISEANVVVCVFATCDADDDTDGGGGGGDGNDAHDGAISIVKCAHVTLVPPHVVSRC